MFARCNERSKVALSSLALALAQAEAESEIRDQLICM